ncbi:hypothetical protein KY321_01845, partial [Candidatus Woesearchaeota archaeon]|nr:hypothetical protein [Candidatus Woesearchaeota archaeon]
MKIVHASDLHNVSKNLETVVNAAKQDDAVFAFTGDWFDCYDEITNLLLRENYLPKDLSEKLR